MDAHEDAKVDTEPGGVWGTTVTAPIIAWKTADPGHNTLERGREGGRVSVKRVGGNSVYLDKFLVLTCCTGPVTTVLTALAVQGTFLHTHTH